MTRAIILLLDSVGVGALPDAEKFGDVGSNTLRHIAEKCMRGEANAAGVRQGPIHLPNMTKLGLNALVKTCNGDDLPGLEESVQPTGLYGFASEMSHGKDTPSGHWEITGVPVLFDWGYFPKEIPCFPKKLTDDFIREAKLPGVLGNKHASGTVIISELGDESVQTGKPIVYTSADSVFQIAAHEEAFGLDRLYELCHIARKLVDDYNIGRVIARPFVGADGHYQRTGNRHDYSVPPPAPTLLDKLKEAKGNVFGIGKIPDIFAHQGFTKEIPSSGNMNLFDATLQTLHDVPDRSLIFTNFVDFDMEYGHRRNVIGYAKALEDFDARLPELEKMLKPGDMVVITADHGCDPTFRGTDHTREYIPVMVFGPDIQGKSIGHRDTFADIGQSLTSYFGLPPFNYGKSFL